jgi:NitT/TauT family transport system substrate-binding protein
LVAVLVATTAGCSSKSSDGASQSSKPDKVTYVTSFGNFGRDSYVWVAKEKGYVKDANIDIQIQPGTGADNEKDLASGKAQFSTIDLSAAILQISNAEATKSPLDIQAVAAIQQLSMSAIMTLPTSGITQPKDLAGKKIGIQPGGVEQKLFPTYAKLAGFDSSGVTWVTGSAQQLPLMLAQKQVDAVTQFVVGEPTVEAISHNTNLTVLPFSKYIGDLYGNALFTSKSLIQKDPDLVKRFRDALLKGLTDALNDPDGAGAIIKKNVPTANPTSAAAELRLMKNYVEGTGAVGEMTPDKVAQMVAILEGAGAIKSALDPKTLVDFDLVPSKQS